MKMELGWKWMVNEGSSGKDIAGRKLLLFGCGGFIQRYTIRMQMDHLLVIDNDEKKQGTAIELNNRMYQIQSPNILNTLDVEKHYIVITAQREDVAADIEKMIRSEYPLWSDSFCLHSRLYRAYLNIASALLLNPLIYGKIVDANIVAQLPEYITRANDVLDRYVTKERSELEFFVPNLGSRVILIVRHNKDQYLLYLPFNKDYYFYFTEKNKRENLKVRQRINIGGGVNTVYEAWDGLMLVRWVDSKIDFTDRDFICAVMKEIHKLHDSDGTMGAVTGIHRIVKDTEDRLCITENDLEGCVARIHKQIIAETMIYEEKLIHGDFHHGNILCVDGQIEIIDWISLAMGDPIQDIAFFYFFLDREYPHDFREILKIYYERELSDVEYRHALAWLIYIIYWKYLEEVERHGARQDELLCELKKRMDGYVV